MSDISANVTIGMPSQLFTAARSFKALANGKIFAGIVDTDPTLPENQVPVYIKNESGSVVQVPQPITINAAGFPVYNGQIYRFYTDDAFSMAVYDSYGAQQFYFENILNYSPEQKYLQILQDLSSSQDGKGDALVAVKQPISGSASRTVHDWISDFITSKDLGMKGDGSTNDIQSLLNAIANLNSANRELYVVPGFYLVGQDLTFDIPVTFQPGAIFRTINGAQLTFKNNIYAGEYKIFDNNDDFYTSPAARPSVKVAKGEVKPEWFGAKTVSSYDEIKAVSDSSSAFMKSWRATTGDYTANVSASYKQSEYMHSYISLAAGKYRLDRQTFLGYREQNPLVRYNKNGGGVIGKGSGISLLVYTDGNYIGNSFFTASDMSGEMHKFNGFKCVFFNPDETGDARYYGKAGAMMLFTSIDSLETSDLWAAGAKYLVNDADGIRRGGVGIQFESVVDHRFRDLLVEHCINGICFSACVSVGTNTKGFFNTVSDIGLGNFIPAWPKLSDQVNINLVTIHGHESKACPATPIYAGTSDNRVTITGVECKGNGESSSTVVTNRLIAINPNNGGITGLIQGNVMNVNYGLITDNTSGFAGRPGQLLRLVFNVYDVVGGSATETGVSTLLNPQSNVDLDVNVIGSKIPVLVTAAGRVNARIGAKNIVTPAEYPYSCFICSGGILNIEKITAETNTVTYMGFAGGSSKVMLPSQFVADVATVRKGNGSTATIKQLSSSDYSSIV